MSAEPSTSHVATSERLLTIALAGNPNAGKTTLFNVLTGLRQKVANYPGVTVERKEGVWKVEETTVRLIDLPGLYSLHAASPDEQIARDVLTGKIENLAAPDAIIAVVDATNLERNLYLVTQLLEYRIPLVVALTMFDEVEKERTEIDVEKLSKLLRVPIVPVTASTQRGLDGLREQVLLAIDSTPSTPLFKENTEPNKNSDIIVRYKFLADVVQETVRHKESAAASVTEKIDRVLTHRLGGFPVLIALVFLIFVAIYSLAALPMDLLDSGFGLLGKSVEELLPPSLFTQMLVGGVIPGVGAVLVFLPQIVLLFFFISVLEDAGYMVRAAFLLDRLMGKVGLNGKAFLPLFSSFACAIPGIMATRTIGDPRDRLTTILIAPFMSCSARLPVYFLMIPVFLGSSNVSGALVIIGMYFIGIVTALIVAFFLKRKVLKAPVPPLVMEMPPYRVPSLKSVLLNVYQNAGMFVKRAGTIIFVLSIVLWWLTVFPLPADEPVATSEIYMMGILVAVIVILGLKKLISAFATRRISIKAVSSKAGPGLLHSLRSNYGVVLLVVTIIAWASIAYYPGFTSTPSVGGDQSIDRPTEAEALEKKRVQTENSYAGRLGRAIEPVVRPLGFDDEMGFALIASFAAREVFVSALKIIHTGAEDEPTTPKEVWNEYRTGVGEFWNKVFSLDFGGIIYQEDTENSALVKRYSPLTALSTMVFFVLAMQCMSTLAIVRRETNSWKYPIIMFVYMTVLAYVVALLTYQGGSLLLGIFRT
jgi:ferrous iron transport protein B